MADKKKKPAPAPNATTAETQSGNRRELPAGGFTAEDLEVLEGTLEERGKALDADLKRMGAR